LGLSADESDKAIFYSTRPLTIPSLTWLFHIEGLDHLFNTGLSLKDNSEFDIESIRLKLTGVGNSDALTAGTILITSESDINGLGQTLQNQISQLNAQGSIKYLVIICDACNNDQSIKQLQNQLKTTIEQIVTSDSQALVITLATQESARVRRARQVEELNGNVTIATMYSDEYATMFNLFFWTSLVLVIIVISIVYVFLTLDPGADTIIYRMTAPRLKAD
jgi:hypothetical protein